MEPKFNIGDKVRHFSDCETIYEVIKIHQTHVNYFYDIEGENLPLKEVPEHELSIVEEV